MARLIVRPTSGSSRELELGARCVLGRDPRSDCLLESRSVSRRHALIEKAERSFFLSDLGSRNGTFLNGRLLEERRRLKHQDCIRIGDEQIEFVDNAVDAAKEGQVTEDLDAAGGNGESVRKASEPPPTRPLERSRDAARPRKIGRFLLKRVLGRGGMGTVYLARDLEAERDVAVKFILSTIGRDESFLDFFHNREAVLARQIDHPNVIRIYEHGVYGDDHFISMEFVEGKSLHQLLKSRRLAFPEILEVLRQIASGLHAAHRRGVVHSDVKPANILLASRGMASAPGESLPAVGAEDADTILLFDTEQGVPADDAESKYDPGLLREIRERAGVPTERALLDPPYYERASEMRFLEHYVERLREDRGCFLLVAGEKGTGKARLVAELIARESSRDRSTAAEAPMRFLELDCAADDGIERLYERVHATAAPSDVAAREVAGLLARKIGHDSIPTVLALGSLECCDSLTSGLIFNWADRLDEKPLVLVADVDSEEIETNESLRALLGAVKPWTKELFLRPLTEYQIERYLTHVFEREPPALLAGDLYRLTRGNMSRLLECFRRFAERGLVKSDPMTGELSYRPNSREFELEEGKHLFEIFRSYGQLEQRILETAALIGYRFFFDALFRFLKLDETTLFFILRNLAGDGFLVEEERTWYRFTNAAFQRFLAERIPPHERPQLHRRIMLLLHSAPVPESAWLYKLRADHELACKEPARAVEHLLEGAYRARIDYDSDMVQEMYHEILKIYRSLSARETVRREILQVLNRWFQKDGNWYAILGRLASEEDVPWVKIADFGISFRAKDEGLRIDSGVVMGTPRYMAPERSDTNRGGPESDIFSLGILAYEMLVGEPPFPHLKGWKILQAYRKTRVRVPQETLRDLPPALGELLDGMLEPDPDRRWDIERVLKAVTRTQIELESRPAT